MNRSETRQEERTYQIVQELGHGAQGSVYLVRDIVTKQIYAAKVYEKQERFNLEEYIMYCLKEQPGFPKIVDTTIIEGHQVILMGVLGDNVRTLKDKQPGKKLTLGSTLSIFYQMVSRLESLHEAGFVHCDIKPDNILISAEPYLDDLIYLVDYGLAHQYLDANMQHIKAPKQINFKGSISYCSLNLLKKKYPSRRDDIESLLYVILHLYEGSLPWHSMVDHLVGRERIDHVIELKRTLNIREYAKHVPESIIKCFQHVRSLAFADRPDYDLIKKAISDEMKSFGLSVKRTFEWAVQNSLHSQYVSCFASEQEIRKQQQPQPSIKKRLEAPKDHVDNESNSMDVDYYDIMSLEIDEGTSEISFQKTETRQNILSSLTPDSMNLSPQDPSSSHILDANKNCMMNIKKQLGACPFDFAEEDDFDYKAMQREISDYRQDTEQQKTVRKISSFGPMSKAMEAIQKERRYSMQTEPSLFRR